MSSAKKSRDPPNPGNEPTEELGYPALVQYTFIPNDTESSEILVSEGDIVQLVYKVGGWVFVRTYEGKVGYIPFSFCKELESSKEVGLTYGDSGVKEKTVFINSVQNKLGIPKKNQRQENGLLERQLLKQQVKQSKRVHFADLPKNRNSCDVCRNFLTSFTNCDQNFTISEKKLKLKPHKLLKLLQTISKDGFVNFGNSKSSNNAQSNFGQISNNRINRRVNSGSEFPIKFGNLCNQCDVLKEIFQNTNRYSMSDIYSTIRNLHQHAVTDSDSDNDDVSEESEVVVTGPSQNGTHVTQTGEKIPKRSSSLRDTDLKQKIEVVRNNSFSGTTGNERCDYIDNRPSSEYADRQMNHPNGTINGMVNRSTENHVLKDHKVNNFFSEHRQVVAPPLTNGFDEDITDFRSAEYRPPLINKWRPANNHDSLSSEALRERPPGIVREQTFEYESMKTRQKEVNFNDPKKVNLNLTSNNLKNANHNEQIRSFTIDSRRKPFVPNGDFSLDDGDSMSERTPNGYKEGVITKCFTTYGQSGKSLTLDRHSKHSSQNFDKSDLNHKSAYRDSDSSKQNDADSGIDRRKVVARKVNPLMSSRNLMTASGKSKLKLLITTR